MTILLVEDDQFTRLALVDRLAADRYVVNLAADGETGLQLAQEFDYDLVMLDVMLPKLDGISVCQRLRAQGYQSPILLLTAKDSSSDRVLGLDAGADDYVVKPFDFPELMARIRALLRRGKGVPSSVITWENLRFDAVNSEVTCNGKPLHLTPKEYCILELFLLNPKRIFNRPAILDRLWDFAESPGEETVSSHIYSLRQKLKAAGSADLIETVHGLGYRLRAPSFSSETTVSTDSPPPSKQSGNSHQQRSLDKIAKTWYKFKPKLLAQVGELEKAASSLLAGNLAPDQRRQAEQTAHKLAGSLGLFGWLEGSQMAREIEVLLQQQVLLTAKQVKSIVERIGSLKQEFERLIVANKSGCEPGNHSPLILIVDDDLVLAEQLAMEAIARGMRVEMATDLTLARAAIAKTPPDAILLDLNFPHATEDGLVLLREMATQFPRIPVLVLTARESLSDRIQVARLGGCAFIHKSLPIDRIIQAITEKLPQPHRSSAANRVMVVNTDQTLLAKLTMLLKPWAVEVTGLQNPQQFWEVLTTSVPNLLILDLQLPTFSGIELCQLVRQDPQWKNLPILVMTDLTDLVSIQQAFAAGANDFIHKPIIELELVTRIVSRLEAACRNGNLAFSPHK